jgi:hypothetical protein
MLKGFVFTLLDSSITTLTKRLCSGSGRNTIPSDIPEKKSFIECSLVR